MKRYSVGILALAIALVAGSEVQAGVIVPNANAAAPGNTDNRFPFLVSGGMRYQQVFAASQFSGPILMTELDLRNGILVNEAFSSTISSILISLSTISTAPDSLSSTFATNIGGDNTQVFSGSLTLSSANGAGPGGTKAFDISIALQTPFLYNPANGNLLIDIKNSSGANAAVGADFFDAVNVNGDSVSRVWGAEGSPNATTGTLDSFGLIVQFQSGAVPEPSSLLLTGLGVGVVGLWRRRLRNRNRSGQSA
jgi:hypothetical protein